MASLQGRRPLPRKGTHLLRRQLGHEEVLDQSAGPLSEAGEHEGQSAVQTPLFSYTAQRLASSADAPDQRSWISRHHISSSATRRSLFNQQAP